MNQDLTPNSKLYSFAETFLHQLRHHLHTNDLTETQFAHASGLTLSQWQDWQKTRLLPTLTTLDQLLLAHHCLLQFELIRLSPFEWSIKQLLHQADTLGLREMTDRNGNTLLLDSNGQRKAVVQERGDSVELYAAFGR